MTSTWRGGLAAMTVAGALLATTVVQAAPITGTIGFASSWTPELIGGTATSIASAEVVNTSGDTADVIAGSTSGDLAVLAGETGVFFSDIDFTTPGTPYSPLWGPVNGFEFDLATVNVELQAPGVLELSGTGTLFGAGFDPTPYTWDFSGQRTGSLFTFSTSQDADEQPVPEPATLGLIGAGLAGIGVAMRRRRRDATA